MFDMLKHNQISAWNTRVVDCCYIAWIMATCQKQYVNCSVDAQSIAVASDFFLSYDWFSNLWSYRIYVESRIFSQNYSIYFLNFIYLFINQWRTVSHSL